MGGNLYSRFAWIRTLDKINYINTILGNQKVIASIFSSRNTYWLLFFLVLTVHRFYGRSKFRFCDVLIFLTMVVDVNKPSLSDYPTKPTSQASTPPCRDHQQYQHYIQQYQHYIQQQQTSNHQPSSRASEYNIVWKMETASRTATTTDATTTK